MISLFKRKSIPQNTVPENGVDEETQTLVSLLDVDDDIGRTLSVDALETDSTEVFCVTSIGTRRNQQDSVQTKADEQCTVCVVCDGMGGLSGGERASALAASGMCRHLMECAPSADIPTEMGRVALSLNEEIKDFQDANGQKIEAGTTLTAISIRSAELFWCSIGDSHIYLQRDGLLNQLNIDHNLGTQLDQMALAGTITQEEANSHPQRAALTSYLGIQELTLISGNHTPLHLQKGDVILQCTDGLYRCLSDNAINQILQATDDLKQAAESLKDEALKVPGAHDNTTVVLTRYKG